MDDESKQDAPLQSDQEQTNQEEPKGPPEGHPRWDEMVREKNELRSQVGDLSKQLEELKEQISARQEDTGVDELTYDEQASLQRISKALREQGFTTKDDLNVTQRALKLDKLSDKWGGKNGYPKFIADDVVVYAKKNGFGENYEAAFRDMHYDAFVQVDATKLGNAPKPPTTEKPGGGEQDAPETDLTREKIEAMSDAEYEKNRDKIHEWLKSH